MEALEILSLDGIQLKNRVNSLKAISKNAVSEEDRIINFYLHSGVLTLTSTDGARVMQNSMQVNSDLNMTFAIPSEKLHAVLDGEVYCLLRIFENHIEYMKKGAEIVLLKLDTSTPPFEVESYLDEIPLTEFSKKIRNFSKHLSKDNTENSVVLLSESKMYVRSTLYHGLTDLNVKGSYAFDSFTISNLVNMCIAGSKVNEKVIKLGFNEYSCFAKVGNIEMNFSNVTQGKPINFNSLEKINNYSGFIANRDKLIKTLNELNAISDIDKIDLVGVNDRLVIRPAIEGNSTNYTLDCKTVETPNNVLNFNHTLSGQALINVLKSLDENYVLLATTVNSTALTVATVHDSIAIRYYIMVI